MLSLFRRMGHRRTTTVPQGPTGDTDILFQQIADKIRTTPKYKNLERYVQQDMKFNEDDALVIVDMQNDFMSSDHVFYKDAKQFRPTLPTPNATDIIGCIALYAHSILKNNMGFVVATQDFHPEHHISFEQPDKPGFPPHCLIQSPGSEIVSTINNVLHEYPELWNKRVFLAIKAFYKDFDSFGAFPYKPDDYTKDRIGYTTLNEVNLYTGSFVPRFPLYDSGTKAQEEDLANMRRRCMDTSEDSNDCQLVPLDLVLTGLPQNLPGKTSKFDRASNTLFICGVLGDYCVLDTAINAKKLKYTNVYIVFNLIRSATNRETGNFVLQADEWIQLMNTHKFGIVYWGFHALAVAAEEAA